MPASYSRRILAPDTNVPQANNIFPSLMVKKNLNVSIPKGSSREAPIDEILILFPALKSRLHTRVGKLSEGGGRCWPLRVD